jgi:MFS family permease
MYDRGNVSKNEISMNKEPYPTSEPESDESSMTDLPEESVSEISNVGLLAPLRIRNFRFLITGTVLSNAAQFIQSITLNWLVYSLTGSGAMLGYLNLARAVASLGIIPAAGVLIDRLDRRKLLLMVNSWLFTITLILGLMLVFGNPHLYYLFIFTFLAGMAQTVDMTLRQVIIFNLVPRESTPNALALIQTGWGLMRSIGPAIGGFLILWFGPGGNFLVQAGAYCLVMFSIVQIQFRVNKTVGIQTSPFQNIREGLRWVIKKPVTLTFMMMGFVLPLFIVPFFYVLSPIYAVDVFHGGPDTLGLLMAFTGIGGVLGGLFTGSLQRVERRGVVQLAALFLLGMTLIGFSFINRLSFALLLLVVMGFFEMIFLATNQTLLQLSIPDKLRGRVTSLVNLNAALMPVGGLVAGFGADLAKRPQPMTVFFGGAAAVVAVSLFVFSPVVRNYRLSQAISSNVT